MMIEAAKQWNAGGAFGTIAVCLYYLSFSATVRMTG
jgi:hypothetical protein